jgi:hypothetical protein
MWSVGVTVRKSPQDLHIGTVFAFRVFKIQSLPVPAQGFTTWTLLDFEFCERRLSAELEADNHKFLVGASYNAQLIFKVDAVLLQRDAPQILTI